MKTTKFFLMAALALTFAACSNDDNDILNPAQTAKGEGITITATLAPKDAGATTRAVSEGSGEIVAEWETHEHIAILYEVSGTKYNADATIDDVDANGVATISFTVASGTPDNTECTLVYPGNAVNDDKTGVKDYADLLATQDGRLSYNLDVRVGAGKIQTTTPGLDVTTQPKAQFAIFKFTLSGVSIDATHPLVIKDNASNTTITTVTPDNTATSVYAALPAAASKTYKFVVTTAENKYIKTGTATIAAGNYYQTTLSMSPRYPLALSSATVDDLGTVIASDGNVYATKDDVINATKSPVAMIAYVGNDAETSTTYNHGLALALLDVSDTKAWCSQTSVTCLGTQYVYNYESITWFNDLAGIANTDALVNNTGHNHAAAKAARQFKYVSTAGEGDHPTGTSEWFLPSAGQWDKMATAAGGYANLKTNAGLQGGDFSTYWSSTECDADHAWFFFPEYGAWNLNIKGGGNLVRACLAF